MRSSLSQNCWLNSPSIARPVEVNSSKLWSLEVSSKLCCCLCLSILLAESKPCLSSWAEPTRVSIIHSTSYKSSYSTITVTIQLDHNNHNLDQVWRRLDGGWQQVLLLGVRPGQLFDRAHLVHRTWRHSCHHREPSGAGCACHPHRPRRSLHRVDRLPQRGHLCLG